MAWLPLHFVQDYVEEPVTDGFSVILNRLDQWYCAIALTDSKNLRIGWPRRLAEKRQYRGVWLV